MPPKSSLPPDLRALDLYSLGSKLRMLRAEKHLTLSRLAAETGLSTALLSKLETDRMTPTLQTLARICRVYGTGLSYFFSEPAIHSVAITRNLHKADEARAHPAIKRTPLHALTARSKQLSQILEIPAGVIASLVESGSRSELTAYVLDGTLRLTVAGSEEELHADDSIVLDTDAVVLWSAGDSGCRVLTVSV